MFKFYLLFLQHIYTNPSSGH